MITILDVSGHQGPAIDWGRVAASGRDLHVVGPRIDAAYVKLTEGAAGPGSTDNCGARNLAGAGAAAPRGAYHFLSALSPPEDQAKHFLQVLADAGGADLPPMLDLERGASGRLPPAAWAVTWVELVEEALGMTPLLYTGSWIAAEDHLAEHPELARCPGWVAAYGPRAAPPPCAPWAAWGSPGGPLAWQWTPLAWVPGISTPCDLSRAWALPGTPAA